MVSRDRLERHQVWLYLVAVGMGLTLGATWGDAETLDMLLWPVLGLLLFVTFTQVPLLHVAAAFRDRRFMTAVLIGNFVVIPIMVAAMIWFLPADPVLRLGVVMVLLMPCTDWYITFTHLSGGDTGRAIAVTPVNLLVQIALLPVYLWAFMGDSFHEILAAGSIATVFVTLILMPLLAAWLLERWATRSVPAGQVIDALGWLPVPLLALVVFLIAASQAQTVFGSLPLLVGATPIFIVFLIASVALGLLISRAAGFDIGQSRALVLSYGTRNSFVILPLALALPAQWQGATVVIVYQSLVELLGLLVLLWVLPRLVRAG
ncbi:MAG: arsenic resistance protein [Paracoccus hibiscisoli]|uniref:arsenic resistance protein n=1 Tax=Paracoccus hibiscisoli TaxID=2023261 RepID=UPI003919718B